MTSESSVLSTAEVAEARKLFQLFDTDNSHTITASELSSILSKVDMYESEEQVMQLIEEVDTNGNKTVDWDEFLVVMQKAKEGHGGGAFNKVVQASKKLIHVKGAQGSHSFSQEELSAFATHMNQTLGNDPDLAHLMPINPEDTDLCRKVGDGILLCKFINLVVEDTIDVRAINKVKDGKQLSVFKVNENLNMGVSAAKSIGVSVVNVGADELKQGDHFPHLVLGIVWQLVKLHLLASINLKNHPELVRLLEDGEELADLLRLPPEQLLLRWFNYHLKNANHPRRVANFGGDVADSECYTVLLSQLAPSVCDRSALSLSDHTERAKKVLSNAHALEVNAIIQPADIVKGNRRLNLAFVAAIFNKIPGLDAINEEEYDLAGLLDDDMGDSREERAFRMWINSLGISELYINNLFEDCKDGLALLKVMDKVEPGIVDWLKSVEKKTNNRFKRVSNCNYAVLLGKQLKFSLVGIGGVDITDGNKKLVLALVWQLMRYHTIKFLAEVQSAKFGGQEVTDEMIVAWANDTVAAKGRSTSMSSFKDKTLANSLFFFDLLFAVESRVIDWDLVTPGETEEDRMLNARYAISVARKLGATIFVLPEDIVEVNAKMIMTFVASIMAVSN